MLMAIEEIIQMVSVVIAAASVVIGVTGYLQASRTAEKQRQAELETRQAQLFMQLYDRWTFDIGEKFWSFLNADVGTAEEYMERIKMDREYRKEVSILSRWHEGVGVLVRFGLLDIRYIAHLASWPTRTYWEKLRPIIEDVRRLQGTRRADIETEYLYQRLMGYLKEHPELMA